MRGPDPALRIAFLTTDNREQHARYDLPSPVFGSAMTALLEGLVALPDALELHVVSCGKRPMPGSGRLGPNATFHQLVVPAIGWGRSAFLGCGLAVRRSLARLQPAVVHAQGTERDCAVSMMLAADGAKLLTIHGHMRGIAAVTRARFPSYYWLAATLERMALRKADAVVALNSHSRDRFEGVARRAEIIPNAVESCHFEVGHDAREAGILLCVGTVQAWKRQLELLEFLGVDPPFPKPWQLVFLGAADPRDPYARAFLDAVAARSGWCRHVGHVDRSGLLGWYRRASLVVIPSIEENCPMVVLEAMAAGLPVAGARSGGIPELVREGETGSLFDPRDATSVRQTLALALRDPALLARQGAAGRAIALRDHHPSVIASRHLELYRDIARNPR